jgi:hypothetical protein
MLDAPGEEQLGERADDRHASPRPVGLRVEVSPSPVAEGALDGDRSAGRAVVEADVLPAQPRDFASSKPRVDRDPVEGAQLDRERLEEGACLPRIDDALAPPARRGELEVAGGVRGRPASASRDRSTSACASVAALSESRWAPRSGRTCLLSEVR